MSSGPDRHGPVRCRALRDVLARGGHRGPASLGQAPAAGGPEESGIRPGLAYTDTETRRLPAPAPGRQGSQWRWHPCQVLLLGPLQHLPGDQQRRAARPSCTDRRDRTSVPAPLPVGAAQPESDHPAGGSRAGRLAIRHARSGRCGSVRRLPGAHLAHVARRRRESPAPGAAQAPPARPAAAGHQQPQPAGPGRHGRRVPGRRRQRSRGRGRGSSHHDTATRRTHQHNQHQRRFAGHQDRGRRTRNCHPGRWAAEHPGLWPIRPRHPHTRSGSPLQAWCGRGRGVAARVARPWIHSDGTNPVHRDVAPVNPAHSSLPALPLQVP